MVERNTYIDGLFGSLADPIRRDILGHLMNTQSTVSQIAEGYDISLAAIAKHITVLEKAKLVHKRRRGKEQVVSIQPKAIRDASRYLAQYEALLSSRLDALENIIKGG